MPNMTGATKHCTLVEDPHQEVPMLKTIQFVLLVAATGLWLGACDQGNSSNDTTTPGEDVLVADTPSPMDTILEDAPLPDDSGLIDVSTDGSPGDVGDGFLWDMSYDLSQGDYFGDYGYGDYGLGDWMGDISFEDYTSDLTVEDITIDLTMDLADIGDIPFGDLGIGDIGIGDVDEELGGVGDLCGQSGGDCQPDLVCCYPCGIPDCEWQCAVPCDEAEQWCSDGCAMVP